MAVNTLDVPTYGPKSTGENLANAVAGFTSYYGPGWSQDDENGSSVLTICSDELSSYSDASRASIMRGLGQQATRSFGSFREYAE